jgi:hypothetical protein
VYALKTGGASSVCAQLVCVENTAECCVLSPEQPLSCNVSVCGVIGGGQLPLRSMQGEVCAAAGSGLSVCATSGR